jgi:chorismate mutase
VIKRLRKGIPISSSWRVNRRVSHSSQRLAYVSPEAIAKGTDVDSRSQSSPPMSSNEPRTPQRGPSDKDSASPHMDTTPAPQPIIIEPKSDSNSDLPPVSMAQTSNKELANEIREKEKLDEDVTVVIPSDAPLNESKDCNATTPKSACSDNTNWSNVSETDMDNLAIGNEIMSAPIKTLMSHHQQMRPRRKMSFTAMAPITGDERSAAPCAANDEQDIKPKMEPPSDPPTSSLSGHYPCPDNPLASVSTHLSLPFNPLNISTYMTSGLGGLLPSPLISPLNQAFFAQQALTSPSLVPNPLSFFSPLANPGSVPASLIPTQPTTASQPCSAKDTPPMEHQPTPSSARHNTHSPGEADASVARGSLDDLQSWIAKGGARGSALSRSNSRSVRGHLNVCKLRWYVRIYNHSCYDVFRQNKIIISAWYSANQNTSTNILIIIL